MTASFQEHDVRELSRRLEEAEETLRAIRSGEVDALVVAGADGDQVFTLEGADHPYRTLIEAMQQGALSLSRDGTVLYCNRCFAEMLKMPQEKIVGAVVSTFLPPAQRASFEQMLGEGRTQKSQGELQLQTAEGTLLPVYLAIAPLPLADAMSLCMVVTDLTEQKKHQGLQETSRRKDEFMAMLAHELRNPLAPIRSGLELLAMRDTGQRETIKLMQGQLAQLIRLVDDLLDVSRMVRGRVELRRASVELSALIRQSVNAVKPAIEHQGQELTISVPREPVWLNADAVRLVQVIENLLNNASKYTDPGGRIELAVEGREDHAVITVQDDGVGIEPDLLPRVFNLFTQSDRSLDRSQGGLGIGLTIVKNLVEMHGGTVAAYSEGFRTGSRFVVQLPTIRPKRRSEVRASAETPPEGRRILVVDDNVDAAKLLCLLIARLGPHEIELAYDGLSAVEKAEQFKPDLLLLDIGLPKMDGFAVARKLRAKDEFSGKLLVALTGYGQEEDRRNSKEAGFDEHLVKPVGLETLKQLLCHPKLSCAAAT